MISFKWIKFVGRLSKRIIVIPVWFTWKCILITRLYKRVAKVLKPKKIIKNTEDITLNINAHRNNIFLGSFYKIQNCVCKLKSWPEISFSFASQLHWYSLRNFFVAILLMNFPPWDLDRMNLDDVLVRQLCLTIFQSGQAIMTQRLAVGIAGSNRKFSPDKWKFVALCCFPVTYHILYLNAS